MIKQAYINGFMRKCAEYGIDARRVLEKVAGPRPEERKAIQRITSNPKTLKALTTPTAAPPRVDDPVWNPVNVQKWVTGLATAPALPKAYNKFMWSDIGATADALGEAAWDSEVIPYLGFPFISGAAINKLTDFIGRRGASRQQRLNDALAIRSGKPVGKANFKKNYGVFSE